MILQDNIKLYHASYIAVEKIDLTLCSEGKDFGKGFYLTTNYEQACRFVKTSIKKAIKNGINISNNSIGYISVYEFKNNVKDVSIFEFDDAKEYTENRNRLYKVAPHDSNIFTDYLVPNDDSLGGNNIEVSGLKMKCSKFDVFVSPTKKNCYYVICLK